MRYNFTLYISKQLKQIKKQLDANNSENNSGKIEKEPNNQKQI